MMALPDQASIMTSSQHQNLRHGGKEMNSCYGNQDQTPDVSTQCVIKSESMDKETLNTNNKGWNGSKNNQGLPDTAGSDYDADDSGSFLDWYEQRTNILTCDKKSVCQKENKKMTQTNEQRKQNLQQLRHIKKSQQIYKHQLHSLMDSEDDLNDWQGKHPENWTSDMVLNWIYSLADLHLEKSIDPALINGESFREVDGRTLCGMTLEQFMQNDREYGQIIYQQFALLYNDAQFASPSEETETAVIGQVLEDARTELPQSINDCVKDPGVSHMLPPSVASDQMAPSGNDNIRLPSMPDDLDVRSATSYNSAYPSTSSEQDLHEMKSFDENTSYLSINNVWYDFSPTEDLDGIEKIKAYNDLQPASNGVMPIAVGPPVLFDTQTNAQLLNPLIINPAGSGILNSTAYPTANPVNNGNQEFMGTMEAGKTTFGDNVDDTVLDLNTSDIKQEPISNFTGPTKKITSSLSGAIDLTSCHPPTSGQAYSVTVSRVDGATSIKTNKNGTPTLATINGGAPTLTTIDGGALTLTSINSVQNPRAFNSTIPYTPPDQTLTLSLHRSDGKSTLTAIKKANPQPEPLKIEPITPPDLGYEKSPSGVFFKSPKLRDNSPFLSASNIAQRPNLFNFPTVVEELATRNMNIFPTAGNRPLKPSLVQTMAKPQATVYPRIVPKIASNSTSKAPKKASKRPLNKTKMENDGEPPKKSNRGRKKGQLSKGNHLWEFLLELLQDERYSPEYIQWVNRSMGIFRIIKSNEIAALWGQKKNRPKMTYEKLSRALRFCKTVGYIKDVPKGGQYPKKLCFSFGDNTKGWQDSNCVSYPGAS